MMVFRSIRWRLQIWYGLILVSVLTGFGLTAYHLERARQQRQIEEDLDQRVRALLEALPHPRRGERGGFGGPSSQRPPPEPPPPEDGAPYRPPPHDAPPRRGPPPQHLRQQLAQSGQFGIGKTSAFYYVIWRRTGEILDASPNAPTDALVPSRSDPKSSRARGKFREAFQFTPPGECLLAGRSISADLAELRRFAWWLVAVGCGVLVLGLAGGGWLAAHAIRPIEDISSTAVKIAAGDLSQRINVADTDNELGRLAGVLNSTFSRLDAAFAQQGRFTSDAAHELRTPVSMILTQTQTALARERTAIEFRKTVEACQRAAQRMRRLIESLLELARLDAGQEPMKRMRFNLSSKVRECAELIQPLADERGIKMHWNLPILECDGDPERLAQVITHLLTNAVEHNKNHGEVSVSGQAQNGMTLLCVADTGQGIPADDLPHVFERFYCADKARSSVSGRIGLGLAITKAIVAAHGGSIDVASQPGVGTTFTVRLPAETRTPT